MAKKTTGVPMDPADYQGQPVVADKPDKPGVVTLKMPDGRKRYAWRKDGVKPVINLADFATNIHSALDGTPGADFADNTGPQ